MSVGVGFTLQPEQRFLEICGSLLREEPDYWEIAPETLWREVPTPGRDMSGPDSITRFEPNEFAARYLRLADELRKPFVAHAVGLSPGTAEPDHERRRRWFESVERDHAAFDFRWFTDHLGFTGVAGRELVLPLPLPVTPVAAQVVRGTLVQLQRLVPDVGVENSVFYFHLGEPLAEPGFLTRCLDGPGLHLLLDLHNVWTSALNAGFDPRAYLERVPFERVIEIHVSGGSWSEPGWLPSGRSLRLDAHDAAVPEDVWELLDEVLPRCPNLRGVTLERMEGSVADGDAPLLREELRRVRRALRGAHVG